MQDDEPSLNIPSLLTLAVVSFFVLRWIFNRDDSSSAGGRPRGRGNAVDPVQVEQISQMFPQLSTRDIMWDLQRNGGSVAATTERILTGRGLETVRIVMRPRVSSIALPLFCHSTRVSYIVGLYIDSWIILASAVISTPSYYALNKYPSGASSYHNHIQVRWPGLDITVQPE